MAFYRKQPVYYEWITVGKEDAPFLLSEKIRPYIVIPLYSNEAYIWDCFTSPRFRGQGIYPKALIETCEMLKRGGVKKVLILVNSTNKASIRGIEKAGFKKIAVLPHIRFMGRHFVLGKARR